MNTSFKSWLPTSHALTSTGRTDAAQPAQSTPTSQTRGGKGFARARSLRKLPRVSTPAAASQSLLRSYSVRPSRMEPQSNTPSTSSVIDHCSINELKLHIDSLQTPESIFQFTKAIKNKMKSVPEAVSEALSKRLGECIVDQRPSKWRLVVTQSEQHDYLQTISSDDRIIRTESVTDGMPEDPLISPETATSAAKNWLRTKSLRHKLNKCQSVAALNEIVRQGDKKYNNDPYKHIIQQKLITLMADMVFKIVPEKPEDAPASLAEFIKAPFPLLRTLLNSDESSQAIKILSRTSETSRLVTDIYITQMNMAPDLLKLLHGRTTPLTKAETLPDDLNSSVQATLSLLSSSFLYAGLSRTAIPQKERLLLEKLKCNCHDISYAVEHYSALQHQCQITIEPLLQPLIKSHASLTKEDCLKLRKELIDYQSEIKDLIAHEDKTKKIFNMHRKTLEGLRKQFMFYQQKLELHIESMSL